MPACWTYSFKCECWKKKIVNSDFNLKLGKIQCEGKINKQTKKNTEIENSPD